MLKKIWNYISARGARVVSSQEMLKVMTSLVGLFHLIMFVFFTCFKMYHVMVMNVLSVLVYVWCYVQARKGKNLKKLFDIIYIEIMAFAVGATLLVGTESGFMLYLIAIIPLGYYAAYSYRDIGIRINPMVYVIAATVAFWVSKIAGRYIRPIYSFENVFINRAFYMVNYMVIVVAVVVFCSVVITKVVVLEEKQRLQNMTLEIMAKFDPLTGLTNRRCIQEEYEKTCEKSEGYAIILADIDDFKKINDSYGHNVGDEVLKAVANVFKMAAGKQGIACRWGGEEILVFLPNVSKEYTTKLAKDILEEIRKIEIVTGNNEVIKVTMTLGVAVSMEACGLNQVTKKADDRLYKGKGGGKNQVVDV